MLVSATYFSFKMVGVMFMGCADKSASIVFFLFDLIKFTVAVEVRVIFDVEFYVFVQRYGSDC